MSQTQHKGSAGVVITIIFIILIISIIIVLVVVANQRGWLKKNTESPQQLPQIELYLKANDLDHLDQSFDANVQISYMDQGNEIIAHRGKLSANAYTPFLVPNERIITVRCWNENHYFVTAYKDHSPRELMANKSKMECTMAGMGNLEINKISGSLAMNYNKIKLNITARDGWWYRLGMCFEWTAGILSVTSANQWLLCDQGKWLNYTKYYPENKTYDWLPEKVYRCGQEQQETCKETKLNKCLLPEVTTPYRLLGKVDSCTYTGKTLKPDESYLIELEVSTIDNKNSLDYIKVIFYDHDRRWDSTEQRWLWFNEVGGIELGSPDQELQINYKQED